MTQQLGQDGSKFTAYCKRELSNMYYLLSFQPDKVVLDGDVKQ